MVLGIILKLMNITLTQNKTYHVFTIINIPFYYNNTKCYFLVEANNE